LFLVKVIEKMAEIGKTDGEPFLVIRFMFYEELLSALVDLLLPAAATTLSLVRL
jgi:hypothetical protein